MGREHVKIDDERVFFKVTQWWKYSLCNAKEGGYEKPSFCSQQLRWASFIAFLYFSQAVGGHFRSWIEMVEAM